MLQTVFCARVPARERGRPLHPNEVLVRSETPRLPTWRNCGVALAAINLCARSQSQASRELPFCHVHEGEIRDRHDNEKHEVGSEHGRRQPSRCAGKICWRDATRSSAVDVAQRP
jgi:hypothetical protein